MELLDVIDENNTLTGKAEERKIIHEKGLWHRQVSCWIMNQKGELLFQKRAKTKKCNPNKWSKTGGHVDTKEEPVEGMIREIKEEIGVDIPKEKIKLLSIKKYQKNYYKKDILHRYYGYDYITFVDYKIEDYKIQKEELSEVKYITIEEMEKIKQKNDENYTFVKWDNFDEIISMLKQERNNLKLNK